MANEGISFTWEAEPFYAMTDEIGPITRKATMYALRATGRAIARTAKTQAPVYHGDDPRVQVGALRKSIKNARRLNAAGDFYELKVGPFGSKKQGTAVTRYKERQTRKGFLGHGARDINKGTIRGVPLYRGQMEARYHFMASATDAANSGVAKGVFEAAYAKAWAKWAT